MTINALQRAGAGWNIQTDTRRHKYIAKSSGVTDEQLFDWLTTNHGGGDFGSLAAAGLVVEQPNGTATSGYPVVPEWDGRPLAGLDCDLVVDGGSGGDDYWRVTAVYEPEGGGGGGGAADRATGEAGITYAFEIGPEEGLITQSLQTARYDPTSGFGPELNGAINVQADGTVSGVQPPTAPSQFSLEYTNTATFFSQSKLAEFSRMVGKVNNTTFRGYSAGEVRMLGASGNISTNGNSTLELRYGVIENQSDIVFSGIDGTSQGGTHIVKDGWDYLWVFYGWGHSGGKISSSPRGAYVERIFKRDDLASIF